ncbi:MAG TPA: hypothetical protein VEG64_07920 [Candidatus Sulfotelmatobacter sp.]|nr:hypothetical protein [Candidatus Sulfotelmatobacter sp.]
MDESTGEPGRHSLIASLRRIWPPLVQLWIAIVLVLFFFIRIWGSQTAKHILHLLGLDRIG